MSIRNVAIGSGFLLPVALCLLTTAQSALPAWSGAYTRDEDYPDQENLVFLEGDGDYKDMSKLFKSKEEQNLAEENTNNLTREEFALSLEKEDLKRTEGESETGEFRSEDVKFIERPWLKEAIALNSGRIKKTNPKEYNPLPVLPPQKSNPSNLNDLPQKAGSDRGNLSPEMVNKPHNEESLKRKDKSPSNQQSDLVKNVNPLDGSARYASINLQEGEEKQNAQIIDSNGNNYNNANSNTHNGSKLFEYKCIPKTSESEENKLKHNDDFKSKYISKIPSAIDSDAKISVTTKAGTRINEVGPSSQKKLEAFKVEVQDTSDFNNNDVQRMAESSSLHKKEGMRVADVGSKDVSKECRELEGAEGRRQRSNLKKHERGKTCRLKDQGGKTRGRGEYLSRLHPREKCSKAHKTPAESGTEDEASGQDEQDPGKSDGRQKRCFILKTELKDMDSIKLLGDGISRIAEDSRTNAVKNLMNQGETLQNETSQIGSLVSNNTQKVTPVENQAKRGNEGHGELKPSHKVVDDTLSSDILARPPIKDVDGSKKDVEGQKKAANLMVEKTNLDVKNVTANDVKKTSGFETINHVNISAGRAEDTLDLEIRHKLYKKSSNEQLKDNIFEENPTNEKEEEGYFETKGPNAGIRLQNLIHKTLMKKAKPSVTIKSAKKANDKKQKVDSSKIKEERYQIPRGRDYELLESDSIGAEARDYSESQDSQMGNKDLGQDSHQDGNQGDDQNNGRQDEDIFSHPLTLDDPELEIIQEPKSLEADFEKKTIQKGKKMSLGDVE